MQTRIRFVSNRIAKSLDNQMVLFVKNFISNGEEEYDDDGFTWTGRNGGMID